MRTAEQSREEFNQSMVPYTAVIVQTEYHQFTDEYFATLGLVAPQARLKYIPPAWIGVRYLDQIIADFPREPRGVRIESIPQVIPSGNFLVCDTYANEGETMEIAMLRLVEQGIESRTIWGLTTETAERRHIPTLETALEWCFYRRRQRNLMRRVMRDLGITLPSLDLV
jgi:hypothetical protein